jgi:ABC-type protease/lipase transport system fused ATPase/permease subunit
VLILGLAALYVVREDLTIGGMIATSIMLSRALAPVEQSIGVWRNLVSARLAFQRIREVLEGFVAPANRMVLPRPRGKLVVSKLAYALDGADEPVFQNLSFTVNPGELLGVTGPTGAGKSSLVRTLIGVSKPARGTVRLDGADIYDWNSDDLGRHIGYVPQVVELLPGTIHENIARFTDAPAEKVVEAARQAGIHDLVLRFPQGYDSVVGGLSDMLSVGTRQRVALARALFDDPQLIVLDEPYSNLDADGIQALMTAIQDLKRRGATTVIVAHRPSVMAHANRVMVLENGIGRVVERSKRADLTVLTNAGPAAPETAAKPASVPTPNTAPKPVPQPAPAPAADDSEPTAAAAPADDSGPTAAAAPADAAPAPSNGRRARSKPKSRKARKAEAQAS